MALSAGSIASERIVRLHPDVVVGIPSQAQLVADLRRAGLHVVLLRDDDFEDIFADLGALGKISGHESGATALALLMPLTAESHLPVTGSVELYELAPTAPAPPVIKARSALLLDVDSGKILFQIDPHGRHAPASLTKVVTALVALDHLRLDQMVTVPASINQLPWDSTRMGLRAGERLTVRELLYGLFLNSGNDAAITLSGDAVTVGRIEV